MWFNPPVAHPLDNPIFASLETSHGRFAQASGSARRFDPAVSPLAGFRGASDEGLAALAALARPGEGCALFLDETFESAPGWEIVLRSRLLLEGVWGSARNQVPTSSRKHPLP